MAYKYIDSPKIKFVPENLSVEEQHDNPFAPGYKHRRKNYYPPEFGKIKHKIIEKYNDRCFLCGEIGLEVHHVDYDKMNCSEGNLVLLCKSCHSKTSSTNPNDRAYWKDFIQKKLGTVHERKVDDGI